MGRVQSRLKHKSGDLSYLRCFNFLGDWEDETVATEGRIKSFLHFLGEPLLFDVIVSSAQFIERIFSITGGIIDDVKSPERNERTVGGNRRVGG